MHEVEHALIIPDESLAPRTTDDGGGAGWGTRLVWLGIGTLLGAAAAWFADPDRGNARRADLAQRVAALRGGTDEPGPLGEVVPDTTVADDALRTPGG